MTVTIDERAGDLLNRQPDAYAHIREMAVAEAEKHARSGEVATYQSARELATLVAMARASYVLLANSGFGYLALHIAATFGHTGQVDVVEGSPAVAAFVEHLAKQQSVADRVRVYLGSPANVVSSLNGPYDVVVLASASDSGPRFEDVVRLTRTGGSIIIADGTPGPDGTSPFLDAVASDPRLLASFPSDLSPVVAYRRR